MTENPRDDGHHRVLTVTVTDRLGFQIDQVRVDVDTKGRDMRDAAAFAMVEAGGRRLAERYHPGAVDDDVNERVVIDTDALPPDD